MLKIVMGQLPQDNECDGEVVLEREVVVEFAKPSLYALIMHNDDYTTMEFVVMVLVEVINLDVETAFLLMMAVHKTGKARVAVLPKEIAEMKADAISRLANEHEYPLLVTLEKMM